MVHGYGKKQKEFQKGNRRVLVGNVEQKGRKG